MMEKKRVRILIVGSDKSVKGGITTVIDSFLNNKWKKTDVKLLPTYIEESSIKKTIYFFKSVKNFFMEIVANSFDIAHIHMSYKGSFFRKYIIANVGKKMNKKIIIHLHGSEFEVFYKESNFFIKKMIKNLFEIVDTTIVLGEKWRKTIKQIAPKANIEVFGNTVKIPEYRVEWKKERINILFLGVLIKRKGIYDLIEAINILNQKGMIEEKNLYFIIGGSGREEAEIKKRVKDYKLDAFVELKGWVNKEEREELLKESQVFILPSYNEGLPMAILEAMSYGIPIISTDVGSVEEAVKNNINGYIVKPGDIDGLSEGILNLINDTEKWSEMGDESVETVAKYFNEKKYFERIEKLYKEVNEGEKYEKKCSIYNS